MLWRVKSRPGRVLPASFVQPCIASEAAKVPSGDGWLHEIKHDGYRLQIRKAGTSVRLFTRRGFDWTERYPRVVAAAKKLRAESCTIDGEVVCTGADGIADFNRLHSRCFDREAFHYAFDLIELDGEDLKLRPLIERKAMLKKLLRRPETGIHLSEHDAGHGPALFAAACQMGLEGIVSKKAASVYKPGPKQCLAWVKVKNKAAPGYLRFRDSLDG